MPAYMVVVVHKFVRLDPPIQKKKEQETTENALPVNEMGTLFCSWWKQTMTHAHTGKSSGAKDCRL
jgi:hypothetical protein